MSPSERSTPLTERDLNRATLARQLLLERSPVTVTDAVGAVFGLQAQEPAAPYLALWNRIADFDAADLDRAFTERAIVKAPLVRITLHAIRRDDHAAFHAAARPILRAARFHDRRFRATGMSIEEADALVDGLLDFAATPRSRPDIVAHLADALGREPPEHLWWALRTAAPLTHAPSGGPWSFGREPLHEAAPSTAHDTASTLDADPTATLVRRYLRAFGPARPQDVSQFTMLPMGTLTPVIADMDDLVHRELAEGGTVLDVADGELVDPDVDVPPRLLGMWDSVLLAYRDRSRVIPDAVRSTVIRNNGDTLATVLVDGRVRGVWRCVDGGVEITPFEPFGDDVLDLLDVEVASLTRMTAPRDPTPFSRYDRWWAKLPSADRIVLTGSA